MSESQDHSGNTQRELVIDHTIYNLPELLTLLDHPFTEEERQQVQAAESAFLNQEFEKALALFLELLPVLENYSDFHLHISKAYDALNNEIARYNHLKYAAKLNPNCWRANNNLGIFYKNQNHYDKALKHYQQALKSNPESSVIFGNLGNLYSKMEKHELAIEYDLKAIALEPNRFSLHRNIAESYYRLSNITQAIFHLEKAVELNPDHYGSMYYLGYCYGEEKRWQAQYDLFKKSLHVAKNQEDLDRLYWHLAVSAHHLNIKTKSSHYFSKYLENNPESAEHYTQVGEFYYTTEEKHKAIPFFEKLKELEPDVIEHRLFLIWLHAYSKKDEFSYLKAIQYAQKAFKQFPDNHFFPFEIARIYTENLNQPEKALPFIEQAILMEPEESDNWYLKGLIFEKKGDWEQALPLFKIALAAPPQESRSYYKDCIQQMALLAEKHQETAFAKACRKRLMQLNQLHNESS
jgi:tetratricopeptide (TPR) repeat protein